MDLRQRETIESRTISLYTAEWEIAVGAGRKLGLISISAAIRYILHDWQRLTAAQPSPGGAPSRPAGPEVD